MIKYLSTTCIAFSSLMSSLFAAPALDLPNEFNIFSKQKSMLTWSTNSFSIENDNYKLGLVNREIPEQGIPYYSFHNIQEQLLGYGKVRFNNLAVTLSVFNANDDFIGLVEEKGRGSVLITSPIGEVIAKSTCNFWGTKYTLSFHNDSKPIAVLYCPIYNFKLNWSVSILDQEPFITRRIDPTLFIIASTFQMENDVWRLKKYMPSSPSASASYREIKSNKIDRITALITQLVEHEHLIAINPTQEDFVQVELITEGYLEENGILGNTGDDIVGCEALISLLSTEMFTEQQKSALYLMLNKKLESLDR